jgi:hypothetical protein
MWCMLTADLLKYFNEEDLLLTRLEEDNVNGEAVSDSAAQTERITDSGAATAPGSIDSSPTAAKPAVSGLPAEATASAASAPVSHLPATAAVVDTMRR